MLTSSRDRQLALPFRLATVLLGGLLICLLVTQTAGESLAGPTATIIAAVLLLGFGLPHGAFDIFVLRAHAARGVIDLAGALSLYLTLAASTFMLWKTAPVIALILFLAAAIVHFAEDWRAAGSATLSHAMAVAVLAVPALTHRAAVRMIFVNITGDPSAAILGDCLLLAAPVACLSGLVALAMLWRQGARDRAVAGGLSLVALIALPPVVGFALFFCLCHSPPHVRRAIAEWSNKGGDGRWRTPVVLLTAAGLGIAAAICAAATRGGLPARTAAASFMTLSVLTVPHMLVPFLLDAAGTGRRLSFARPSGASIGSPAR